MTRNTASRTALILMLLNQPGCGASEEPKQRLSPVAQANAAIPAGPVDPPPTVAPFDPSGSWTGLLGCAGRDFPVALSVATDGNATITLGPAINSPNYISPDGRRAIEELPLTGSVHPAARVIQFVEAEQPSRPLTFSLLVSPDDEAALLTHGRCEYGVAQRGGNAAIEHMQQELRIINERRVVDASEQGKSCPANLENWIAAGEALPLDNWARGDISTLWEPELMDRMFGQPLDAIDAEERQQIRLMLAARCGQPESRRRSALIGRLMQITDYRSFRLTLAARYGLPIIKDWLRYTDEALLGGRYAVSAPEASVVYGVPISFQFEDLAGAEPGFDKASLSERLQPLVQRAQLAARTNDLIAALENTNDFFRLTALHTSAALDEDLDQPRLLAALAQRLPVTARAFAGAAQDAPAARQMVGWLTGRDTVCPTEVANACSAASQHFQQRLPELLESLADAETRRFETLETPPATPAGLAARVTSDRQFAQRYQGLLTQGPLAELADGRRKERQRLQSRLQKALAEQAGQAKTTVDLAQLEARWFLDEDLDVTAARPFRNAVAQQRADQQPFSGPAGKYLNALYNRDSSTLARFDRQLTQNLQPILSLLAQQMDTVNMLGAEMLKLLGSTRDNNQGPFTAMVRELRNPSAIRAVAMRYLLDYESIYAVCLDSNAREFVFSERVDTVTRTSGGIELSRIEGITTATRYRVKPQLAPLFQQVFSRPRTASSNAFYDALFGDDALTQLLSGVTDTMRRRACTDPEILRLEQGMIRYLKNRQQRWASGRQ